MSTQEHGHTVGHFLMIYTAIFASIAAVAIIAEAFFIQ